MQPIVHHDKVNRYDVLDFVTNQDGVGIELGIAQGSFSEQILRRMEDTDFYLYSVDAWAGDRGHGTEAYMGVINRLSPWKTSNSILRLWFGEALQLFPDNHFDFIYVDGYAHTGENDGQHFRDWWPKLKQGGIMAGDDYSTTWPRVISAVNRFVADQSVQLEIIPNTAKVDKWSLEPTWFVRKK